MAVAASAPPRADEALPLATATPYYGKEEPHHLASPSRSGSYQKGVEPEYPAQIRNTHSGGYYAAGASAPPGPALEEEVDDGQGPPREVQLDVPLPPKGAAPRDLWAAVLFFIVTCLLATLAVRLGLPSLGVWEAELNGHVAYSDAAVSAARTVLGVALALALAGGLLAMVWLHLMLHWSGGASLF